MRTRTRTYVRPQLLFVDDVFRSRLIFFTLLQYSFASARRRSVSPLRAVGCVSSPLALPGSLAKRLSS